MGDMEGYIMILSSTKRASHISAGYTIRYPLNPYMVFSPTSGGPP
jgi:hypothetical protein